MTAESTYWDPWPPAMSSGVEGPRRRLGSKAKHEAYISCAAYESNSFGSIVDLCLDRAELSNISVIKQELSFYDRQDVRRPPS
jgi:hypothetical protein